MPDLQAIVQRMIDAGESEEDIATVIRAQSQPLAPRAAGNTEARIGADPRPGGADFKILGIPIHVPGPDKPRVDENMAEIGGMGIPPEAALMGVPVARAVLKPGLSLAGRATAGAGSVLSSVTPVIKYEVAKHALEAVGLPESVASVAAIGISGYRRGGAAKTAAGTAPAAAEATTEAAAIPTAAKPTNVVPAASRPIVAPVQAATSVTKAVFNPGDALKAAKEAFAALGEAPRPAEASNAMEFIRRGASPADAVAKVIAKRPALSPAEEFAAKLGTLSDAEVRAALDLRNARGEIKSPSAETARARKGR